MSANLRGLGFIVPVDIQERLRPAPGAGTSRQDTDFARMSNENLKFAIDTLTLHSSPYLDQAWLEVGRRIERGTWLDVEAPPPLITTLPGGLIGAVLCLFSEQYRRQRRQAKNR